MASPRSTFTITAVDKTKAAFKSIDASLVRLGRTAGRVGGGVAAIGVAAAQSASGLARYARTTELLGLSSEQALNRIVNASQQVGISYDQTAVALQRLARRSQEAVQGNENLQRAFAEFGITLTDLRTLAPDELFEQMAAALEDAERRGVDLSAAMGVLDTEGIQLLNTMRRLNSDAFNEFEERMESLGLVMDREVIARAVELDSTIKTLTSSFDDLALIGIQKSIDKLEEFAKTTSTPLINRLLRLAGLDFDLIPEEPAETPDEPDDEVRFSDRLRRLAEAHSQELIAQETQYLALEEMAMAHFDRMIEAEGDALDRADQERQKAAQRETQLQASQARTMIGNAARNSRAFFEIDKALAIGQAALDGKQAVLGAYKVGARIGGPPLGAAFAATAGAATASYIAAIASQSYGQGGGGVATGGPGGESATAGELAGGGGGGGPTFQVQFNSSLGLYDESSLRRLFDALTEAAEDGNQSLSGRFVVDGI